MMMLLLAGPAATARVLYEDGVETVYRGGQRSPSSQNYHVRPHHERHHKGKNKGGYDNDVIATPVSVPDGGSTLAMMAASTALLLLGYRRLRCKRIAA
jgi:hypothetical protein